MAITDRPEDLWLESEMALDETRKALDQWDSIQEYYKGPWYAGGYSDQDETSKDYNENVVYSFAAWVVPQLAFSNPRVMVKSRRLGPQEEVAEAIQGGLNRWILDTNFVEESLPLALDHTLMWGVCLVKEEAASTSQPTTKGVRRTRGDDGSVTYTETKPQDSQAPMWPAVQRIPQHRYFRDPHGLTQSMCRFQGHEVIRSYEELLEEAKEDDTWDLEYLEKFLPGDREQSGQAYSRGDYYSEQTRYEEDRAHRGKKTPPRTMFKYREVWVPEHKLEEFPDGDGSPEPEDGYHGTIFTVASIPTQGVDGEDPHFIREPRPFYGPATGPYIQVGVHPVPNESFPLSPILAVKSQIDALNRMDKALQENAEAYKRPILFDAKQSAVVQALQQAKDREFVPIPGFDPQKVLAGIEIAGNTQQELVYRNDRRDQVNNVLGFTEMQRGAVSGEGTATEATLASANADVRVHFIKQQWTRAVAKILRAVAWYMYYDDRVLIPLGPKVVGEEMGMATPMEGWYQGGEHDPESGYSFDDLELDIEPYSMERTDEGVRQRRAIEMMEMLMTSAPLMAQMPNPTMWGMLFGEVGNAMNMPELERIGTMFAQTAAQARGLQPGAPQNPGDPRLSKDVGRRVAQPQRQQGAAQGFEGNYSGAQAQGAMTQ